MKTKLLQPWATLGLALAAICFSQEASAVVFVNRQLQEPAADCTYLPAALEITSSVSWDDNYQNAWGRCMQLDGGPPYIFENTVFVDDGATLQITGVPITFTQLLQALPGSTLSITGSDISFAHAIDIRGSFSATGVNFSAAGLDFTPISLFNAPTVMFSGCHFDFSDSGASPGVLWVANVIPGSTLTIDDAHFTYAGASTAVLVFIDHRAGPLRLTNSTYSGANGQAVNIVSASDATFENNSFDGTDCSGTLVGFNCGAPVSFVSSRLASITGNVGANNKINGMILQAGANGPTLPAATWSTSGGLPLVVMGDGNLTLNPDQTLNLAAGTVLKFDAGRGILLNGGALNLLGDPASPVSLTSLNDNSIGGVTIAGSPPPAPGDWTGVQLFGQGSALHATASFSNCSVKYAGGSTLAPAIRQNRFVDTIINNCAIGHSTGPGVAATLDVGDSINVVGSAIQNNGGIGVSLTGYLSRSSVRGNTITGNAEGVHVEWQNYATDVSLLGNQISGNRASGVTISNVASPIVVNNIISANGQHGISKQGSFSSTLKLLNNSILGNGGDGIRLLFNDAPVPISNNLISQNVGFGIAESSALTRALPRYNDMFGNGGGVYQRTDGTALGIDEVNMLPGAGGNISLDPLLGTVASGTSTDLVFAAASGTSTLTDTSATLIPDALVGLSINPSLGQEQQFLITGNTSTTITVLGDVTLVAAIADAYLVSQPLAYGLGSPLIDAGDVLTHPLLPPTDFGGRARIIDGGAGRIVDIGSHEFDPAAGN